MAAMTPGDKVPVPEVEWGATAECWLEWPGVVVLGVVVLGVVGAVVAADVVLKATTCSALAASK